MNKNKLVVYEGTPRTGYNITVPGIGVFQKDKPRKVSKDQLKTLLEMGLGFREFNQEKEISKPPMEAEKPATNKKQSPKKKGKKKK